MKKIKLKTTGTELSIPDGCAARIEAVEAMDDVAELKRMLVRSMATEIEELLVRAAIIKRIWRLAPDEDLSDTGLPQFNYLVLVAEGTLRVELLARYVGHRALLRNLARLALAEQARIVAEGSVRLYDLSGDYRSVPVEDLSAGEMRQVFADVGLRDQAGQAMVLRQRRLEAPAPRTWLDIEIDERTRCLVVGGVSLSQADLAQWLARLAALPQRRARRDAASP